LKASLYNYCLRLPNGTTLFLNFYTLSLLALRGYEAGLAKRILYNPNRDWKAKNSTQILNALINHGFLIPDDADEIASLKENYKMGCTDQSVLSMTIIPTLACNFRCVYCYQERNPASMAGNVEDAVIRFVQERMFSHKSLNVTWFGGEPLLFRSLIERLSEKFIEICQNCGADYSADMVTNGYLLDLKTAEKLAQLKISHIQVTLDGPPAVHNRRRPLADGRGTFHRILKNIHEATSKLKIHIRMNVDETNKDHILDLMEILESEALKERVGFYIGRTYAYTSVCQDISGWCLSEDDFSLLELETSIEMARRGFRSFGVPKSRNIFCMADHECAYAITPRGGIVKCWNEVAESHAEVGHLLESASADWQKNLERWRQRNPFDLECASCKLLPICMGGCPYVYGKTGKVSCHTWKYYLDENIFFYYCLKRMSRELEISQKFWALVELYQAADKDRNLKKLNFKGG